MEIGKNLISDERIVEQFLNILPELEPGEEFFYMFMARGKYVPNSDFKQEAVLKRGSVGNTKHLLNAIKRLASTKDTYTFDDKELSSDALVFYMKPNPRSIESSMFDTVRQIASNLGLVNKENNLVHYKLKSALESLMEKVDEEPITKDDIEGLQKIFKAKRTKMDKPERIALTSLQEAISRRVIVDVDIDVEPNCNFYFSSLIEILNGIFQNGELLGVIATKGGFHIQLETAKIGKKLGGTWLVNLMNSVPEGVKVEMKKDGFLPVPGVLQGGSYPRLIYHNDNGVVKMSSDSWTLFDKAHTVIDPDGWDRADWNWSFYNELITHDEFKMRVLTSTVKYNVKQQEEE